MTTTPTATDASTPDAAATPAITRSTGITVPGWPGPRPGGGYRGLRQDLDDLVTTAAQRLHATYGTPVEIRFNSDRRSGGAFLPNGLGISASMPMDHATWARNRDLYPEDSDIWPEPKDDDPLGIHIFGPAHTLTDPSLANLGPEKRPYFGGDFDTLDHAFAWVAEHMLPLDA